LPQNALRGRGTNRATDFSYAALVTLPLRLCMENKDLSPQA